MVPHTAPLDARMRHVAPAGALRYHQGMEERLSHPFPPVYDSRSRILVLGSFPSERSRKEGFYYSHPRNRFWPMLGIIFHRDARTKEERTALLLDNRIALWDSVAECRISHSADSTISDPVPNDIPALIASSGIERIIANGNAAYSIYMRYIFPAAGIEPVRLPSTSPANARWTLQALAEAWQAPLTSLFS